MNKYFFLDRDGVIIEEENYLADPAKARLCQGCAEAFRLIAKAGYGIIVVSNQSGVARGYFTLQDVKAVEQRIEELLKDQNAPLPDAWYYCPHHPKASIEEFRKDCDCRKPEPGLLLQAGKDFSIDYTSSLMIGDKLSDLEAAFSAGCGGGALVRTGHGSEQELRKLEKEYLTSENILDAVKKLLAV